MSYWEQKENKVIGDVLVYSFHSQNIDWVPTMSYSVFIYETGMTTLSGLIWG